jgi:hypothetical protein
MYARLLVIRTAGICARIQVHINRNFRVDTRAVFIDTSPYWKLLVLMDCSCGQEDDRRSDDESADWLSCLEPSGRRAPTMRSPLIRSWRLSSNTVWQARPGRSHWREVPSAAPTSISGDAGVLTPLASASDVLPRPHRWRRLGRQSSRLAGICRAGRTGAHHDVHRSGARVVRRNARGLGDALETPLARREQATAADDHCRRFLLGSSVGLT